VLQVAVDVGGTFTDLVAYDSDSGEVHTFKLPSVPSKPELGFLEAVRKLVERGAEPERIARLVHAGTVGSNLLLGQKGLKVPTCALLTTYGFRDLIEIGRQNRPELYNVFFQRPKPLVDRKFRFEVRERTDARGGILRRPSEKELTRLAKKMKKSHVEVVAVSFLNSFANGSNESLAKSVLEEHGLVVHTSHQVNPESREYERTSTTVVNAILSPVVSEYLERSNRLIKGLHVNCGLQLLSSSGGVVDHLEASSRPISVIESGPAAGVMGAAALAKLHSFRKVISFDMGGTTAKAGAVVDYQPLTVSEIEVGGRTHMGRSIKGSGYPVRYPSIDLAEVSAGGGTIISAENGSLKVGPMSAGADPGPVCYGKGGDEPTITDANLHLGRLGRMLGGELELDPSAASASIGRIGRVLGADSDEVASNALVRINSQMARAINIVSRERGLDPREFALVAFGGAGPMHAAELADLVGIRRVIVPVHPGLFSAMGMLASDMKYSEVRGFVVKKKSEDIEVEVEETLSKMASQILRKLEKRNIETSRAVIRRSVDARYRGQGYDIEVQVTGRFSLSRLRASFGKRHSEVYGFRHRGRPIEIVALRVQVTLPASSDEVLLQNEESRKSAGFRRRAWFIGGWTDAEVTARGDVKGEQSGPLIIEEYDSTTLVPPNWSCSRSAGGNLLLRSMRP
jgi:N-methylhydantoinase A